MTPWQQFVYCVRIMPAFYSDRVNAWLMNQHEPEPVGDDVLCFGHGWRKSTPWPCRQWTEAARRRAVARQTLDNPSP